MKRPWQIWAWFLACLALVLAAMIWLSFKVVRMDRLEAEASLYAEQEVEIGLALWQIDSLVFPILARESLRPHFYYDPELEPLVLGRGKGKPV